jgi:hypothetical protein
LEFVGIYQSGLDLISRPNDDELYIATLAVAPFFTNTYIDYVGSDLFEDPKNPSSLNLDEGSGRNNEGYALAARTGSGGDFYAFFRFSLTSFQLGIPQAPPPPPSTISEPSALSIFATSLVFFACGLARFRRQAGVQRAESARHGLIPQLTA